MSKDTYSPLDRLLHRLALGNRAVAELTADLDRLVARQHVANADAAGPPVFITGLARSGTTILLQALHASGTFRSLTYADMPFVLAPNLWKKLRGNRAKTTGAHERAHGDRIQVDEQSPEAFEEVFWRIADGDAYLAEDHLAAHEPDGTTLEEFRAFVARVVGASGLRYLSKNNSNLLRLDALHRAFPEAIVLIPFRDPVQHAHSLMRQHQRFLETQAEDPFVLDYMNWLGHREFGQGHLPFRFDDDTRVSPDLPPDDLRYWIAQWIDAYRHVRNHLAPGCHLVCYEELCTGDSRILETLGAICGVNAEVFNDRFSAGRRYDDPGNLGAGGEEAADLYRELRGKALKRGDR